ncbi:ABC transporter ATP-binding protein [Streptomyces sp. NBC_00513]|uniref:ABC transporter ATP-binding protein n=1 Tax=unclassified Streptomyces TaxID=2593676 RepID=UPI00225120EA|nr:ABC transporter ATP-binding protein [Streptomyces sp. NBC_00424]MCX5074017.1 ABC transporter ATP-binding protein [Streptomyces sp. NBC_00424]WUD42773.1 ABC transporter ATP-binding protein [Streptomyces sp. NBC_00513]
MTAHDTPDTPHDTPPATPTPTHDTTTRPWDRPGAPSADRRAAPPADPPADLLADRPATTVVELTGVTKEYPGGVAALRGVDLTVASGELLAIVGPSGSGKSTLLHIVGTLDRPTAGSVSIAGYDVATLSDRALSALRSRHVGFVFQSFHLVPGISARANVAEGLLYCGFSRAERGRRAAAALERVGLGDRMDHRPHELSGGQKQRVAIARAVAGEPDLLLADEPTGALDTASGESVMELLRELNRDGATIAVITHDQEIAASLPRQVRIRDGEIVADVWNPGPGQGAGQGADRNRSGAVT